jgi:hypothetical protein
MQEIGREKEGKGKEKVTEKENKGKQIVGRKGRPLGRRRRNAIPL